ncbi:MAG: enoyl-CoA hydratase-related protein, partial [Pseudomonadota bacterium]
MGNSESSSVKCDVQPSGIATVCLNRPLKRNAFDDELISRLTEVAVQLDADKRVRIVVLTGSGEHFSAGADLEWMRRSAEYDYKLNLADARALAELLKTLNECSKPLIGQIRGAVFGGGVGLVACCDFVLATEDA